MSDVSKSKIIKMKNERIKQLEIALEFYARTSNYSYSPIDDNIPEVNKDNGKIARKVLGFNS